MDKSVYDTLALALEDGAVDVPESGDILFLRADAAAIPAFILKERLICQQTFKPAYEVLTGKGYRVLKPGDEALPAAPLTLILPPRQKDEARGLYARAMLSAPMGGVVLACLPNTLGSKTAEKTLRQISGATDALSKHKCRAFWAVKTDAFNTALAEEWVAFDQPKEISEGITSRPGLFSWDRIDAGSALLAETLPEDLKGRAADIGAGNGYLSRELLTYCPGITHVDLYEAERRALSCARATLGDEPRADIHWWDVRSGLPNGDYDVIISNPPFHIGRADDTPLGQAFIRSAAKALGPKGELFLVANRHLPYEGVLGDMFKTYHTIEDSGGYKVLHAAHPKRPR